jgi:hypothetical protein
MFGEVFPQIVLFDQQVQQPDASVLMSEAVVVMNRREELAIVQM